MKKPIKEDVSAGSTGSGVIAVVSTPLMSPPDLIRRSEENQTSAKYSNSPQLQKYEDIQSKR